jgi:hypothetical protein
MYDEYILRSNCVKVFKSSSFFFLKIGKIQIHWANDSFFFRFFQFKFILENYLFLKNKALLTIFINQ